MSWQGLWAPLRFIVVGITNTLVGLVAIYACKWQLGFSDVPANVIGYLIGLAVSFCLNRGWTFQHSGAVLPALVRFLIVFALAYLLNLATVLVALNFFSVDSYLAQAIGVVPYTLVFFLGSRHFAFRAAPM